MREAQSNLSGTANLGGMAAVLRSDIVDSTNLLVARGAAASAAINGRLGELLASVSQQGHLVETRGDGSVVAFGSVSEAATAALALQAAVANDTFSLRVCVSIDESGEGNARLEATCPRGAVVVDEPTRRALLGTPNFSFSRVAGTADTHIIERTDRQCTGTSPQPTLRAVLFTDALFTDAISHGAEHQQHAQASELSESAITEAGGTIIDTNGAGHVGLFSSCTAALDAARRLHRCASDLRLHTQGPNIDFGAGVSVGDVVVLDGSAFGLCVVEAARLLAHATPGVTMCSREVAAIATEVPIEEAQFDVVQFKGLPEPSSVLRLQKQTAPSLLGLPKVFAREPTFSLAGRDPELSALQRLWHETVGGDVRAVVISGEEGVGKTRLVRELACRAHAEGATVLYGASEETLRSPFGPVAAALGSAASLDAGIQGAIEQSRGPLAVLLADETTYQSATDTSRDTDQFELFGAVADTLGRLAERRPVLLVLDDMQWSDRDTLGMVEHLISHSNSARLMIVATCRAEDLDTNHPVQTLLQAARPGHRTERCSLERLEPPVVVAMLEERAGSALMGERADFVNGVAEVTGGNPLFIEELIVHLISTGFLQRAPAIGWTLSAESSEVPVPDSLVELMAQRATRLDPEARKLLTVASVMGTTFPLDVLAEVANIDLATVLDAVEAAEDARLVRDSDIAGVAEFADEICRTVFSRDLRPNRRALVHRQIAEALERLRPHQIEQLAIHWQASPAPESRPKALHYLRLVGEREMAAAAWESSVDRHRQVLDLLAHCSPTEQVAAGLADASYRLGLSLRKIGNDEHRPHLLRAAGLARKAGDPDLLARCAFAMMRPGAWYPEAATVDDDIVAMCEDTLLLLNSDDPLRPRVLAALATNLTYHQDTRRRRTALAEAQGLAKESGDLHLIGETLAAELIAEHDPAQFERRRELADEVRRIGRAIDDRSLAFAGSWFRVLAYVQDGDMDSAEALAAELRPMVEATREYWPSFLVSHFATAAAVARCQPDAPELVVAQRQRFEHQPVDWFGVSVIQQATIAMGNGTLSEMLAPFAQAAEEYGQASWAAKWNFAFSKAYLDAGETDKALAVIASNPELPLDNYWLASTYHLGLLGLQSGHADICESVIEKLTPYRGRFAIIGLGACIAGQTSTALGQAHLGLGQLDKAEELFRESAQLCEAARFPYFATNAQRFLAQTLIGQERVGERVPQRRDEIEQLLRTVAEAAKRFGFTIEATESQRLLELAR